MILTIPIKLQEIKQKKNSFNKFCLTSIYMLYGKVSAKRSICSYLLVLPQQNLLTARG